ncbi:uncharacterized protein TRUGW13939_00272 [Talaromyces rugulosus]|uniref:Yeast cell wall synthesis Kre9/Knh1 C-terminal domain-containing protein n=1 Tax=Talaromyces rugulosus TaxID=121627 RepID=A0A7H8QGZ4_TALRU|nr:uncharacterized protein TRUGW13939_00272 [Talaromyces rugulosus]QKX53196.1 hypothetical protein TRUGW13939_00272 [Talaromyces rugulosus]
MIGWTTILFSLLCPYTRALPFGTLETDTFQPPGTMDNRSTTPNGGYICVTVTYPNTTTYTSTIFSTITANPAGNHSIFTITKTAVGLPATLPATPAAAGVTNGVNQLNAKQTPKQNSSPHVLTTFYLTKTKTRKQYSSLNFPGDYQALDQNDNAAASDIVETATHTIFNTVSATKQPDLVTNFITVTHTTVITGKPATILTTVMTIRTTLTSVTPTKTVTTKMKVSTESDGKRDVFIWKRDHPEIEYFEDGSTTTSALSPEKTMKPRAVPTAPQQTSITVTKTYTPSTTVYTTKTITVSGTWVPWVNSTTTMTIPATVRGGGSEAVQQHINAVSVATQTVVEPIVSTVVPPPPPPPPTTTAPPPPPTTTAPPPTTSIKTVDVTKVVTISNQHTSTITKTTTHIVTSTTIPASSVVTQMTTIMDTVTSFGIYTLFLIQAA